MRTADRPTALGVLLGAAAAVTGVAVYVTAIGYLDLRASSIGTGALLGWDSAVVAIVPPRAPVWEGLAIAAVTTLAFWPFWWRHRTASSRWHQLPVWTALVTLLALTAWAAATTEFPYSPIAALSGGPSAVTGGVADPLAVAWLRQGALSPVTPVFVGVLAVLSLARPGARRATEVAIEDEPASR
ncbi:MULTISPECIES: hypothetical protein [unclassified Isoptericola]|uniref:hypothetical protein n=1 Tax=unclassified Isoptericola TaxID=2623355 RepID=UPI0027142040|nr:MULTISPECIES: hypothetical protein [unclassified Isoptericola]MDO8143045.1 hypothetical protein [Isoptericola sp. 178]MDO8150779.1 hypothetical protein [Isoptericola sp. b408]